MLIKHLQAQTDVHSTKILDLFLEHFGVRKIVDDLGIQKKRNEAVSRDPRDIAPLLDQIALMSQAAELFDRFIRNHSKVNFPRFLNRKEALESAKKVTKQEPEPVDKTGRKNNDGLLQTSELNRRMQEVIGQYMLLEEFFMVESSRKASIFFISSIPNDETCKLKPLMLHSEFTVDI